MKTATLKKALEMMLDRGGYDQETTTDIKNSLEEINELQQRYDSHNAREDWHDSCCLLTDATLSELQNIMLYNFYGELYRKNKFTAPTCDEFIAAVRAADFCQLDLTYAWFTDSMITTGYELICDLYADNELEDLHDSQGHFIDLNELSADEKATIHDILADRLDDLSGGPRYDEIMAIMVKLS